jgi:hypothetical protein
LLAINVLGQEAVTVLIHAPQHLLWVEQLCYTVYISAMGRRDPGSIPCNVTFCPNLEIVTHGPCLFACTESADMANDCLAFHHVYALIVLMLVYLHQGELKSQPKSCGYH